MIFCAEFPAAAVARVIEMLLFPEVLVYVLEPNRVEAAAYVARQVSCNRQAVEKEKTYTGVSVNFIEPK